MKRLTTIAGAAVAAVLFTSTAMATSRHGGGSYVITAPVVDAQPLVEIVQVSTPREVCRDERVEHYVEDRPRGPRTSTIVGTVLGAAIGNNIVDGDDREGARIAGALLGGAIGRDVGRRKADRRRVVSYEQHCEIEHVTHEEERVSGYRVRYRYDGQTFVTRTDTHPGDTIRLRVSVAPIH